MPPRPRAPKPGPDSLEGVTVDRSGWNVDAGDRGSFGSVGGVVQCAHRACIQPMMSPGQIVWVYRGGEWNGRALCVACACEAHPTIRRRWECVSAGLDRRYGHHKWLPMTLGKAKRISPSGLGRVRHRRAQAQEGTVVAKADTRPGARTFGGPLGED